MADIVDRLKRLLLDAPDSQSKESSGLEARLVHLGGYAGRQQQEVDVLDSSGDTVPDLQLLEDSVDPSESGVNPYETSSDFHWKRP